MVNLADLTITELIYINAFDLTTGAFKFQLSELQNATIANSQETTDITGRQGRKLNTLKKNKSVTISGSNGLISNGLLATQVGGEFVASDAAIIMWPEDVTITGNKATINYEPSGTTGNEIAYVYIKDSNGVVTKELEQGTTAAEGVFTYAPASKSLAFSNVEDGTSAVVYYKRKVKGNVLTNYSDNYSGKAELYIDALAEDTCANVYRVQFHIFKADFSGEFDFEMGDDQTVHSFEAEALAGACNTAGELWTYTVFGVAA